MHGSLTTASGLLALMLLVAGCADSAPTNTLPRISSNGRDPTQSSLSVMDTIVGVGLALAVNASTYPEVRSVIVPSPANAAGVLQGDKVLAVDGEDVLGKSLEDLVARLRGVAESQVELKLDHLGTSRTVRLTRQVLAPAPE